MNRRWSMSDDQRWFHIHGGIRPKTSSGQGIQSAKMVAIGGGIPILPVDNYERHPAGGA